jgi:hypothetical protein
VARVCRLDRRGRSRQPCEAPKRVIIVWSHDDKGNLLRRRECKLPSGEIIRFVQDANGRPVRAR